MLILISAISGRSLFEMVHPLEKEHAKRIGVTKDSTIALTWGPEETAYVFDVTDREKPKILTWLTKESKKALADKYLEKPEPEKRRRKRHESDPEWLPPRKKTNKEKTSRTN
ncbi:Oidioi.mRNA.OKI2018_I69.chr2.g7805.t1.cds [Oikopleura dioica]|uniref:Oidioi.mRNA.OKI2018_I69.chr2.g7805.t1.cds n=1 Tax=Oikopleura dioica TaxID=34765 RepID=A0ABN7T9P7_OIKDI|nr:Oidioi.mRNA.OKI2018_I69.chr2.g7805.t1.cds [Oikopleura dioica]